MSVLFGLLLAFGPAASAREGVKRHPDLVIRLNQALFETKLVMDAERQEVGKHVKNFAMQFKEDGLHVKGHWLLHIPFEAILGFDSVEPNVFEIRVRRMEIAFVDLKSLTKLVLKSAKARLEKSLKGCSFDYVGEESDKSRAIRVTINMAEFLPAFSHLAITEIVTKDNELLLKAGKP